jgi:translocation protein SEC62
MEQQQKAPKDIRAVADFLRSSKSGMKTRIGVLNGKRVDYFKGKFVVSYTMLLHSEQYYRLLVHII